MNKAYRLIWSDINRTWVAVSEIVKARGKRSGGSVLINNISGTGCFLLKTLASSLLMAGMAHAAPPVNALPTGGTVSAGQATLQQTGNTLNINQSTAKAALNWNTFNVGRDATVNFNQPSASSVTLNRVTGGNPSQIFGHINANGQVFLSNGSGIYFAPSASVNVGAFTATTHSITDNDFMAGRYLFNRNGAIGSVINDGNISTNDINGYIALLAPEVRNNGVIIAQLGTVALAAGEAFELQFDGNNLLNNIRVEASTIQALVDNGNAVHAPDGLIILSAQAVNSLQGGGIINNTGTLEASGFTNNGGVVRLTASDSISHTGTINVDAAQHSTGNGGTATLIASLDNPNSSTQVNGSISARGGDLGGNGGFVETSGGRVNIGGNTRVDTRAPQGKTGLWLLDPTDYTIAASGGNETGASVSASLTTTDRSITVADNIHVNDGVSWSANKLTLTATSGDININAVMTASGTSQLDLEPGSGNVNVGFDTGGTFKGQVNFPGRSGASILTISNQAYNVINNLTSLQGINGNGYYALGANIDATATSGWNAGAGFAPLNSLIGTFDGLGHTINNLTINRPTRQDVGLFDMTFGTIRNVGLVGAAVTGYGRTGSITGGNYGLIENAYAAGNVTGSGEGIGGLVGIMGGGLINNAHANVAVTATTGSYGSNGDMTGGLVGRFTAGSVSNAYATGNVTSNIYYAGGLIGAMGDNNQAPSINNVYATGAVQGSQIVGGLVGMNYSTGGISNAYATGSVNATAGVGAGGLVGRNKGSIATAFATGAVAGTSDVGGLVGTNYGTIVNVYATGAIVATGNYAGGLVGTNNGGSITNTYATGNVVASNFTSGGLVGYNQNAGSNIANSYATGTVSAGAGGNAGGLVGWNQGTVSQSYATGNVSIPASMWTVGGLVSWNDSGTISDSYSTGRVTGDNNVGGLVGSGSGTITNTYTTSLVVAASSSFGTHAGSFIGWSYGATISEGFFNSDLSNMPSNGGLTKTTADMSTNASTSGTFDAYNPAIWSIVDGSYPTLKVFSPATNTFTPTSDNSWTTAVNWSAGHTPTIFDTAAIGANSVNIPINVMARDVIASTGSVLNFTGNLVSSLTLGQSNPVTLGAAPGDATLNFNTSGKLNLPSAPTLAFNGDTYTVIRDLGTQGSVTGIDLQGINKDGTSLAAKYVLGLDINASATSGWTGGFMPLGRNAGGQEFSGTFDGLGHSVNHLTIDRPSTNDVGLFGFVSGGSLRNMGLIDATVTGQSTVGSLVGNMYSGVIENVFATGNVSGSQPSVGGIVGQAGGVTISNANAAVTVSGESAVGGLLGNGNGTTVNQSRATSTVTGSSSSGASIGGLVGSITQGTITDSYATGTVDVLDTYSSVGGLVGYGWNSNISGSHASGNVTGGNYAGGLVGNFIVYGYGVDKTGDINNSYATGAVTGANFVGGLVGKALSSASSYGTSYGTANASMQIADVYATGAVVGVGNQVGGLVGFAKGSSSNGNSDGSGFAMAILAISNAYASGSVSGISGSCGSGGCGNEVGGLVGHFESEASSSGDFSRANVTITTSKASGVVNGVGDMVGGLVGYGKSGSYGAMSIMSITKSSASGTVTGTNNVGGLVGNTYVGTGGGGGANLGISQTYATGNVTGTDNVGGLVGNGYYVGISESFATGTVDGDDYVGGLIGQSGHVSLGRSFATGNVSGNRFVGGLVGYGAQSDIANVYALGNVVSAIGDVGGLIGAAAYGTISNAFASGLVTATVNTYPAGGLLGNDAAGYGPPVISNSFFDHTVNSSLNGVGNNSSATGVAGKSSAELKTAATFTGWSLRSGGTPGSTPETWRIYEGNSTPLLVAFLTPLDISTSTPTTVATSFWHPGAAVNATLVQPDTTTPIYSVQYDNAERVAGRQFLGYDLQTAASSTAIYLRLISGSSIYGDTPNFSYSYYTASIGGSVVNDANPTGSVVWSTPLDATSNVATYSEFYVSGITLGNSAYTLSAGSAIDWIINLRPLTITADNASRLYGSSNPSVSTFSAPTGTDGSGSGLVNGNTISSVTNTVAGTATSTANAGTTHAITPSAAAFGSGSASNYSITYTAGTLTIGKAHLTVTADNQSRLYGAANPTFSETISGYVNGEDLSTSGISGTATGSSTATTATGVGAATIVASASGLSATNYDFPNLFDGILTIVANTIVDTTPPPPPTTIDPPVVVETPDTTIPPSGGLDLSVNASPIVETSAKSIDMASGAVGEGGISVSLVRSPSVNESGIITVSIPKEMATAGSGFNFPLPVQIIESAAASGAEIKVTTANGDALPAWLRYLPETKSFSATAVPDGAFPIEIIVTVNGQSTTIVISERAE